MCRQRSGPLAQCVLISLLGAIAVAGCQGGRMLLDGLPEKDAVCVPGTGGRPTVLSRRLRTRPSTREDQYVIPSFFILRQRVLREMPSSCAVAARFPPFRSSASRIA